MSSRIFSVCLVLLSFAGQALAQAPTPTPVDSNIAVSSFAQSRGNSCSGGSGSAGCGGCYPLDVTTNILNVLSVENPEWAPIGPMMPGGDPTLPPNSKPVLFTGTVELSKINVEGDFTGTHLGDDQNTFITVDPDKNGLLATGNNPPGCNDEGCNTIEMEREFNKYPLFAWAGEGDRIAALGRWIFDCGHSHAAPAGKCSNSATSCEGAGDCSNGGTCTNPAPNFGFRAELHPPQALAVMRSKSIGKTPATRADVYISADAGAAGDRCTVSHLGSSLEWLTSKQCYLNHCSVTTNRSCLVDADCAKSETCLRLDPAQQILDINTSDFEFDMPLPPKPAGATDVKTKFTKIKVPKGSVSPKAPIITKNLNDPTPSLHVSVPMSVPIGGKMPNVFAQSISAAWKGDKTKLTHVQVTLTGITINNPLKNNTPAVPQVCSNPSGGLTTTSCTNDAPCQSGSCAATGKACHANSECKPTDFCNGAGRCLGGITPGWEIWAEVNGDWVKLTGLNAVGASAPFTAPPYAPASQPIAQKFKFDEFVPSDGSLHIATTGHSLTCVDTFYGRNLIDGLNTFGLTTGAACLLTSTATDHNPGRVDVTHSGTGFAAHMGSTTTCTTSGKLTTCSAVSTGGSAGTCSSTARLCVADTDCPTSETCNITGGGFALGYTIQVK